MKSIFISLLLLISILSCNPKTAQTNVENQTATDLKMNSFVDSLLQKMTLDEKIGQTVLFSAGMDKTGPTLDKNYIEYMKKGMVGGIFNLHSAKVSKEFQKIAVEQTRLGIPLLFGLDVIHGYKTIFPIPLAESSSWDLTMIEQSARVAATEAASVGVNWTYAPMVDIARDPRWGRVSEGAGEDVYLGSQIAAARVKGFQGDDLSKNNTLLACAKHYAAYGAVIAGRDYNTVDMSEIELRNTYLPPFKAAIDAGAGTIMTAFNELNGVPCSANKFLITDILKNEWGFKGFVVTDYTSITEMMKHGFSKDEKQAGEQAINAGVDMDMQGGIYLRNLKNLVSEGKVSEQQITDAAKRILEMKYKLGLFQNPYKYSDEQREKETEYKPEFLEASKQMAEKSMVLLKNDNQLLPLSTTKKIALIGPLVKNDSDILGSWAAQGDRNGKAISVYEGIQAFLGANNSILYAKGCEIDDANTSNFNEAISVAKKSDVVVLVLGEGAGMSGEASCRTNLDLPGVQKELIAAIKKTGKPIVLVLMNGRPLTLEYENKTADAILEAWWPGTMGGEAIANVLYGTYNPSGKLPITFPRNVGQIPLYYNVKSTGRPYDPANPTNIYITKYLDSPNSALYPFGYGLSYTTFKYSNLVISKKEFKFKEPINVSVTVTNTGKYAGEEVVQLYIRDLVGSITRPVKELKRFEKIMLQPNESKKVNFTISSDDLAFYSTDGSYKAEPGDFNLFVGTNSEDVLETSFALIQEKK